MNKLLDVAEYMHLVGALRPLGRAGNRRASTASKNAALLEIAATIEKREAHILEENAADVRDAKKADLTPALIDRLTPTRSPLLPWPRACARSRSCRPGGRHRRNAYAAIGHSGRQDAGAARRHRHHLRIAPERDGRCRRVLPEERQRGHPAWR